MGNSQHPDLPYGNRIFLGQLQVLLYQYFPHSVSKQPVFKRIYGPHFNFNCINFNKNSNQTYKVKKKNAQWSFTVHNFLLYRLSPVLEFTSRLTLMFHHIITSMLHHDFKQNFCMCLKSFSTPNYTDTRFISYCPKPWTQRAMTSRASFSGMMEGALNLLTDSFKISGIVYFTTEKNWTSSNYKGSSLPLMQTSIILNLLVVKVTIF